MVNKVCLVMHIRVSQVIRVVSRSSSLPGLNIPLQMDVFFINTNFLNRYSAFRSSWLFEESLLKILPL